jgi:hypothetical protein
MLSNAAARSMKNASSRCPAKYFDEPTERIASAATLP